MEKTPEPQFMGVKSICFCEQVQSPAFYTSLTGNRLHPPPLSPSQHREVHLLSPHFPPPCARTKSVLNEGSKITIKIILVSGYTANWTEAEDRHIPRGCFPHQSRLLCFFIWRCIALEMFDFRMITCNFLIARKLLLQVK